ncbi:AfsR/SARP family transcriptional regulator [Catenuloplanes japonicus]|uniref:AfsR/SARP family transcriptional regulator n=1 Tax=Catenuloplanes japonicus TaxID=33876 RepID=UPI000691D235|nr:BTAD domain-containing putative transcriptional regulator [Catenuloplanes japonicus]
MIDIRVLGAVELRHDGVPVPIGDRQAHLLAVLVAADGEVVPDDSVTARLRQIDTPALHVYVSRLRRALEPDRAPRAAPRLLVRRGSGYALEVPGRAVDARRLESAIGRAPSLPDADALTGLRAALADWRGRPFGRFADEPWAAPSVTRLTEARRTARETAATILLRLGRADDAAADARALIGDEPLHGGGVRLLALALWASRRSGDALTALRQHRDRLADQLGLDPEPELAALEHAILDRRDDVLRAATGGRPATVRPAQLPRPTRDFTGRERELAALDRHADGDGITVICGIGGVGKTTLALHWAHAAADRYPDGLLHVDLRGYGPQDAPLDPGDALAGLLGTLGVPDEQLPPDPAARTALLRSLLADRRMLLLLDNARDTAQVLPLLPGAGRTAVLITSRSRLPDLVVTAGAHAVALGTFPPEDGRAFVRARLSADRVDRTDPASLDAIVAGCGGLPLALALVCARAVLQPGFDLAAIAEELRDGLDAFTTTQARHDVRTVFSWSYRHLAPGAAQLSRLLALHPGPDVALATAASIAGRPIPEVRATLGHLVDAHLVEEHLPARFRMHDLLRAHALEQPPDDGPGAVRRMRDHYLHSAANAALVISPVRRRWQLGDPAPGVTPVAPPDESAAVGWLDREYTNVMAAVDDCTEPSYLVRFAWALIPYQQDHRLRVEDSIRLARRALPGAEPDQECFLRYMIVRALLRLERRADARHEAHALVALARQNGDTFYLAHGLLCVATSLTTVHGIPTREQADAAYPYASLAHQEYLRAGRPADAVYTLDPIGWYHYHRPDGQATALHCFENAVRIFEEQGHRYAVAEALTRLALFRRATGRPHDAVTAAERALDLYDRDTDMRVEPLTVLYACYRDLGDDRAAATRESALALIGEHAAPRVERLRAALATAPEATSSIGS